MNLEDWQYFKLRPEIKNLPLMEQKRAFLQHQLQHDRFLAEANFMQQQMQAQSAASAGGGPGAPPPSGIAFNTNYLVLAGGGGGGAAEIRADARSGGDGGGGTGGEGSDSADAGGTGQGGEGSTSSGGPAGLPGAAIRRTSGFTVNVTNNGSVNGGTNATTVL